MHPYIEAQISLKIGARHNSSRFFGVPPDTRLPPCGAQAASGGSWAPEMTPFSLRASAVPRLPLAFWGAQKLYLFLKSQTCGAQADKRRGVYGV